jgi:TetR/AcrR family fatty acid metabolism transcriptional regulator
MLKMNERSFIMNNYSLEVMKISRESSGKSIKEDLQEQLFTARRNQILDAATKVFADKGFHATAIKDIAREADIANGTIYIYFENKMALMLGILDRMNESEKRETDFSQFTWGDLRGSMKAYIRHRLAVLKADNFEIFKVVISEILVNKELRDLYYLKIIEPTNILAERYVEQWAGRGIIKPGNAGLVTRAISGMVVGIILQYIIGDKTLESAWDELPDVLTDIILDGLESENTHSE